MKKFDRIKWEEDLFFEALGQADSKRRSAFLDQTCAGRPALRARLERLLAVQVEAERFFAEAERATGIQMEAHQKP
jgi:hypothetical protein